MPILDYQSTPTPISLRGIALLWLLHLLLCCVSILAIAPRVHLALSGNPPDEVAVAFAAVGAVLANILFIWLLVRARRTGNTLSKFAVGVNMTLAAISFVPGWILAALIAIGFSIAISAFRKT